MDIGVLSSYQGTFTPITGVKTYLFKSSGSYMGKTLTTDASGLVTYDLPEREYKVRGDYLGYQWWSDPFTWTASDVVIPEGEVTITVTDSGSPAQANVYVFTSGGSYMGLYAATDASGEVSFLLPADGGNSTNYNGYKFRADYSGTQTWSDPLLVTADVNNPVEIAVGGSATMQSLRLSTVALAKAEGAPSVASATRQSRSGEVQVASLFMLPGLLAGLTNSAFADSNGEHLYYYHSDHLGTPLFLTDIDGVDVWRGEYLPFGEVFSEDTDPDGDGVDVVQPFRFPGQYEDEETGLYYNYFRDYDPKIGRYVEADPIGLSGGVSLFTYAGGMPINNLDPMGLAGIGAGGYFIAGGEGSINTSTCCENDTLYEITYITACGGLGIGLKGTAAIGVSFGGVSIENKCPRTRYYFKHENVFFIRSVNVQADSSGPSAGIDVGLFGASTAWIFCSDTIWSKKKIGCCIE